jgi:ferredoxin
MAYVVTAHCDKCKYTQCVDACPAEAFREGETMLYIDPETCIECELCAAECPVEAIYADSEVPTKWRAYIDLNKEMATNLPLILARKDPLPTAKTLEELQATEGSRRPANDTGRSRRGRTDRRHHRWRRRNWS